MSEIPTVEEAFVKLDRVFLDYVEPDVLLPARDLARALALAVAREIFSEHHPRLCGIWAAAYNDMLIEDIERLGE